MLPPDSYFKAEMHQIRFPLGLCRRPRWGSLQRSPRPPIAGFKGLTCKGRGGEGMGWEGRGGKEKGARGRGRKGEGEGRKGKGEGE